MEIALTPLDFLRRARKLYAAREAVVDGRLRLTYLQFSQRCEQWSAALLALGVMPGDRVATIAPNTHQHLEQFYAIPAARAVIVPVNYRLAPEDFPYIVNHSGASVLCVHADFLDAVDSVRASMPGVRHFVSLEGSKTGWLGYEQLLDVAALHADYASGSPDAESDLLAINYTSGTTSRPKGVMITHRNAWMNSVGTLVHWAMTPADRYLWTLPMFHANGWTFTWTVTAAGAAHVCLREVNAANIYAIAAAERITHLCAAPTVLISLANGSEAALQDLPRDICVFTAGAPPAAATLERIESDLGWSVTHVYGLTETSPFISIGESLPEHAALSASNRAVIKSRQGVELVTSGELRVVDERMVDVSKDGTALGEIIARGNTVMLGYYHDPDATAAALRGGWFHTGDGAVVHSDGYIEIKDRFKDVIISGGENISSIEVESALLRHPAILEVAVVGMPHPRWGESPHAFVVLRPGTAVSVDEMREFARSALAHFKVPSTFHFVADLPKTATGKIQKFVLRGRHAAIVHQ